MREHDAEQSADGLRELNETALQAVSGGEVKITGEAYIPFVGTFLWFSNGGLSFMSEDWAVTHIK